MSTWRQTMAAPATMLRAVTGRLGRAVATIDAERAARDPVDAWLDRLHELAAAAVARRSRSSPRPPRGR